MRPLLIALFGIGLFSGPSPAQTPISPKPTPPPSLLSALQSLPPDALDRSALVLTVAPQSVYTPDVMARESGRPVSAADPDIPVPDDHTLAGVTARYDRIAQKFGPVTALAPATMVVLNTQPTDLDLSAGHVPMKQALKILFGTLSPQQMHRLGTDGLGMEDLTDEQRAFFTAAVPRDLQIVPTVIPSPAYDPKDPAAFRKAQADYQQQTRTLPADAFSGRTRLHANLVAQYTFTMPGGSTGFFAWRDDSRTPDPLTYKLSSMNVVDAKQDTTLRAEIPNAPKDTDLRLNAAAFAAPIPLDGLKTVDDLVTRVSQVTHTELYCDPHYASQPLFFLGDTSRPRKAADLLGALDLCLTAAWRRVGPAYVLTDDREGVETRRQIIKSVVSTWNGRLKAMIHDSAQHLATGRWWENLPFAPDDPGALSPDLVQTLTGDPKAYRWGGDLLYSQLPSAVQADLRARLQTASAREGNQDIDYQDMTETTRDGKPFVLFGAEHTISQRDAYARIDSALTSDSHFKVGVEMQCRFSLAISGFGSIALDDGYDLFSVPFPRQDHTANTADTPKKAVLTVPHRGVLCAPRTAQEAQAVVDRMAALGLNTLFCDAFSNGHATFPNTIFPPTNDEAKVLGAAIAEGKIQGVQIYAVLDTLRWRRTDPPHLALGVAEDVTVTGQTAAEALAQLPGDPDKPKDDREMDEDRLTGGWVSPADPTVGTALTSLVDQAARVPGLAGLVFRNTLGPGYLGTREFDYLNHIQLGYGPDLRLAFLRARHADPMDVTSGTDTRLQIGAEGEDGSYENTVDISLPGFENDISTTGARWLAFRAGCDRALMARLFASAHSAAPTLPLWVQERTVGISFEPWTKPDALPEQKSAQAPQAQRVGPSGFVYFADMFSSPQVFILPGAVDDIQKEFLAGKPDAGLIFDLGRSGPLPALKSLGTMIQTPPPAQAK